MRTRFLTCLAAGVVALATALHAQVSSVTPRIVSPIDDQSLTMLKGNIAPVARAEFDKGKASPSTQLRNVRLVLSRSPEQQAALETLMAAQLDKNSPEYHHWLTPAEFNRRFGAADSDVAAITAWLQSQGLTVEKATSTGSSLAFSGTISQIENAFHLSMHAFQREGIDFIANVSEPKIPSALTTVVAGVAGLSTYAPKPHLVKGRSGMFNPGSGFAEASSPVRSPRPELTLSGPFLWITPADAATMYNTPNSYNGNFSIANGSYTGTGVTIGIGGVNDISPTTVVNYRNRFLNGDSTAPIITNIDGSAVIDPLGATDEAYIDNELAGGLAPGATIHFYTANPKTDGGISTVINQVINDNSVDIFSLSFGLCEMGFSTADNQANNDAWKQMAMQGIAVTVSTGDSGAAGCDNPSTPQGAATPYASYGLQVNGLASTPFNIAVGGTDTYGLLSAFSTYVNNNQSDTNSYRSVLSYIPEATWNDSTMFNGHLSGNVPNGYDTSQTNIVGGSGGASSCSTQSTTGACVSGYAKPSWQRGPGVPNDHVRDLPDVSLMAGNGNNNAAWLVCTDDSAGVSGTTYTNDCSTQGGNFYFSGFGGTSTSAPAFAGILALVQESQGGAGHRLGGDALKTLYDMFNGTHASAVFHDTTQGNISVYCSNGTPDCKANTAGYNFLTGYDTTSGYDLATGMGSVDATNLIKYWSSAIGSTASTITVTPSRSSITTADSLTVHVTVSGGSGTPTGTVSLSGGGYTSSEVALDGTGKASFTVPAGSFSTGTVTLTVAYSGDTTYASTTGTGSVTVTPVLLTPMVTVTPASSSIFVDQSLSVTVKVAGSGATPTGTVTLTSGSYTSAATSLASGSATITIPASTLAVGSATLTATYSGDSAYKTATGAGSVTVAARVTPTVTVTPASSSIFVNQPLSVTVNVAGSSGTPTGTVTLSGGGYTSAATTLASGSATINIPANSLTVGAVTLSVSYSGDTVYATATGTSSVTVKALTPLTPTVTVIPASSSLDPSQSLDVTVKVTGAGATPTGTVKLSSGSYTSAATTLSSGSATITIPANTFSPVGSVTLTAAYSGDSVYTAGTGTGTVTINAPYSMKATTPAAINAGGSATSTVTVTSDGVYSGTVAMACSLTSSPAGAQHAPSCSVSTGSSLTFDASHTTGTTTLNILTTAPTSANLDRRGLPGLTGAGGAVLALLAFFGIPARRRAWRAMLGLLVLIAALSSLSACGGSHGSTGGGGGTPGTTAGTYTFTVTGTGTPAVTPAPTATVTLTVN
ncbi:Ig-like domain repeat protein [Occallatibacter riparius]|uniref:Ig-like domain repeat protein n=1 Tax=Occallatibacter riparius TaxID=1002689 RepID=A0A9J7BH83_9BACT|nr:Ig-like domain repeat protein [Occallatibacter riparius]UWZ82332.1 Ig-like domain repeat protein [Occallatibacter riparius]